MLNGTETAVLNHNSIEYYYSHDEYSGVKAVMQHLPHLVCQFQMLWEERQYQTYHLHS